MADITHKIRFTSEAKDARAEIQKYEDQIVAVSKTADAMAEKLGGGKLIQAAHNWVGAVDKIGGVTKLTRTEQDTINRSLDAAMQKYVALGQVAPTKMRELYEATKPVPEPLGKIQSMLGPLTTGFAGLFSVGAAVNFVKGLVSSADQLKKTADQASMTAEEVQRLQYIGAQTGSSFEGLISATQNLQQRLGSDDKGLAAAVKTLGINLDDLSSMGAYDQITAIGAAIERVPDPTQRAALAAEIFGKNWKEILPALVSGMRELGDEATVMADRTVDALDTMGDRADAMALKWKAIAGTVAVQFADALGSPVEFLGQYFRTGNAAIALGAASWAATLRESMKKATADVFPPDTAWIELNKKLDATKDHAKSYLENRKKDIADAAKAHQDAWDKQLTLIQKIEHAEQDVWINLTGKVHEYGKAIDESASVTKFAESLAFMDKLRDGTLELTLTNKGVGVEYWKWGQTLQAEVLPRMYSVVTAGQVVKTELGKVLTGIPGLLQQAFTGGGSWGGFGNALASGAGGALGAGLFANKDVYNTLVGGATSLFGSTFGAGLSVAMPGIGTAIGALMGPLLGKLGNALFKTEGKQVNDLRDQYIAAAGGFEALAKKAVEAGTSIDQLLRADKVKTYEAAIKSLDAAFERQNKTLAERKQLESDIAGVQAQIDAIKNYTSTWQEIDAAAQRYGITMDQLGAGPAQLRLRESATDILNTFTKITKAGGDAGGTLAGMSDEVSALVAEFGKFGLAIPENLRPLVEELMRAGLLLDASGNKITDLAGLKWGDKVETEADKMTTALEGFIAKLDELVAKLAGLDSPSRTAAQAFNDRWRKAPWEDWPGVEFPDGGSSDGRGREVPGFAGGTGGRYLDFGRGTLAVLHGRERVMTERESQATTMSTATMERELRQLRRDFAALPRVLRDAVLLAR